VPTDHSPPFDKLRVTLGEAAARAELGRGSCRAGVGCTPAPHPRQPLPQKPQPQQTPGPVEGPRALSLTSCGKAGTLSRLWSASRAPFGVRGGRC